MRFLTMSLAAAIAMASVGVAHASDADFVLKNKTGYQIDEVYVGPHSSRNWGNDIMGSASLSDGQTATITFPHASTACKFDIKVKYNDGDTAEWGNIDLCQYESISLFWDANNKTTRAVGE